MNQFVKVIDNFASPERCEKFIKIYDKLEESGFTYNRTNNIVQDQQVAIHEAIYNGYTHEIPGGANLVKEFSNAFFGGPYKEYLKHYTILHDHNKHTIKYLKLQKTLPGQGYHSWHSEDGNKDWFKRLFTFTLYLNDVDEGGETEFLYLSQRIKAQKGRLAFFPTGFEFTHRGNPPLSGEKYILTGWVEFE